jgi:hypothetical protein
MQLIEQRDPEVPVHAACEALNVSRASLYRSWRPPAPPRAPVTRVRAPNPRRLDDDERQEILDTFHLPESCAQRPRPSPSTPGGGGPPATAVRCYHLPAPLDRVSESLLTSSPRSLSQMSKIPEPIADLLRPSSAGHAAAREEM